MKPLRKKGQLSVLQDMPAGVLLFIVGFIIVAFGASFLASIDAQQASGSVAKNITGEALAGVQKVGLQAQNIGLVFAMMIVIGLLVGGLGYFIYKRNQ